MDESFERTTEIQARLDRLRAGDGSARDELLALAADRLARLARKMLKGTPAWPVGSRPTMSPRMP